MKLMMDGYKRSEDASAAVLTLSVCLMDGALCTLQFAAEMGRGAGRVTLNEKLMSRVMNWTQGFPKLGRIEPGDIGDMIKGNESHVQDLQFCAFDASF